MTLSTPLGGWRLGLRRRRRRSSASTYLRRVARDQVNPRYRRFYETLADVTESAQTDAAFAFDRATDAIEQLARGLSESLRQSGLALAPARRGPGRPRLTVGYAVGRRRGAGTYRGRRRRRGRVGRRPVGRRRRRTGRGPGRPPTNGRRRRARNGRRTRTLRVGATVTTGAPRSSAIPTYTPT